MLDVKHRMNSLVIHPSHQDSPLSFLFTARNCPVMIRDTQSDISGNFDNCYHKMKLEFIWKNSPLFSQESLGWGYFSKRRGEKLKKVRFPITACLSWKVQVKIKTILKIQTKLRGWASEEYLSGKRVGMCREISGRVLKQFQIYQEVVLDLAELSTIYEAFKSREIHNLLKMDLLRRSNIQIELQL